VITETSIQTVYR